jgi:hypothetical protein
MTNAQANQVKAIHNNRSIKPSVRHAAARALYLMSSSEKDILRFSINDGCRSFADAYARRPADYFAARLERSRPAARLPTVVAG